MAQADPEVTTTFTGVLKDAVDAFAESLLGYFGALAAVGALAMALIELAKKVRHSEMRYHAKRVTDWFSASSAREQALAELVHLTTGVEMARAKETARTLIANKGLKAGAFWVAHSADHAVFALPVERMMGHIQDAADTALQNPARYPELYAFMTDGAAAADVEKWRELAQGDPAQDPKARAELYARLSQIIKRKLDAFQLYTKQRWTNGNQLAANVVGAIVMFAALITASGAELISLSTVSIIGASLLGGVLAPLAKDMVSALQKVKSG